MKTDTLVDQLAARANVPRSTARAVLRALSSEIVSQLAAGETIHLPGVGVLGSRLAGERTLRNVVDGRKMLVDSHFQPTFRASARLREALRGRTPQLLRDPAHQRAWRLAETLVSDLDLYHRAQVPTGLRPDSPPQVVEARCAAAFGAAWARARERFDEQTPAPVRGARDHLALAAQRQWSAAD